MLERHRWSADRLLRLATTYDITTIRARAPRSGVSFINALHDRSSDFTAACRTTSRNVRLTSKPFHNPSYPIFVKLLKS